MPALIQHNLLARLAPRQWGAVFALFVLFLVVYIPDIRNDRVPEQRISINVWDVSLCVLFDAWLPSFLLLLVFFLMTGADLVAAHRTGTLQITRLRESSLLRWWLAKVLAWGILAFGFVTVFLGATVVASLLRAVPVELANSAASAGDSGSSWYLLPEGWSTMAYSLSLAFYMAVVLWVLFTLFMSLSLWVLPNLFYSYLGFLLAFSASVWITGTDSMFSVSYFLSPSKHFEEMDTPLALGDFGWILGALMFFGIALGYVGLRRQDL